MSSSGTQFIDRAGSQVMLPAPLLNVEQNMTKSLIEGLQILHRRPMASQKHCQGADGVACRPQPQAV